MKLVIITGPHAVGKMTVGQELQKLTGLMLLHNHMTIELVANFFGYGSDEGRRLVELFRHEIFDAVSKSDLDGMIFTFMWAFDLESDWEYIRELDALFTSRGAKVYYVELCADRDVRLVRNKTENRLLNKPTKRDVERSEKMFLSLEERHRLNSFDGELKFKNYMRLDNTNIEPCDAAKLIAERFSL